MLRDVDEWSVQHDDPDGSKCKLLTKGTLAAIKRQLYAPMVATQRKALETNLGWNIEPGGLLWNDSLLCRAHPVDHVLFDWMHVFFVSGIFNITLFLVLHHFTTCGVSYQNIHDFVAAWSLPRRRHYTNIADVFSKKRVDSSKDAQSWKCTASEGLSLLQILAHFMASVLDGHRQEETKSHARVFLELVHMIELLLRSARRRVPGREYADAACAFLTSFRNLFGAEWMTPKFHYAVHFSWFMDR